MMADLTGISSVPEFLARIRQGMAPRTLRLFAAQGLLPVSREDLIRLLLLLSADGDAEIAEAAQGTLATFSVANLQSVLSMPKVDPLEIDLIVRCRQDESLWETAVRHPGVANETLRWLARVGAPRTQDAIVTNQMRLLGCLEILEDLRANPGVSQDVLRRVHEFEEDFLRRATVWAMAEETPEEPAPMPSIEEVLADLKALGMRLPGGDVLSPQLPEPESGAPPELRDAYLRLGMMNTHQRIIQALKGSREERLILVRDRCMLVVRAVLTSPKLAEGDVEKIAGMRSVNEEALRMIGARQRWLRRYPVVRNLVFNPKTPPPVALQLVRRLTQRDLGLICRDHNVPETVRKVARSRYERPR